MLASAFRRVLPGSSDSASIFSGLQVEPAPGSGGLHASLEAFSVKVEPAPDSGGLQIEPAPGLPHKIAQRPLLGEAAALRG